MSFISLAAACLQAIRLTRLGRKMTALVVLGAAALGAAARADAGTMKIETLPVQSTWVADGTTEYEVQVRADSTDISDKTIKSAEWDFTVPTGLESYMTFIGSTLPSTNNPSTNPNDFFYNVSMNSGFNWVDSTISSGELDHNGRLRSSGGAINRSFDNGLLGSYFFTVNPTAPQGTYNFGLHSIYIYDTSGDPIYGLYGCNAEGDCFQLEINNNQFQITPEPATLALIGLGSGLIGLSRRLRRRAEEKKTK